MSQDVRATGQGMGPERAERHRERTAGPARGLGEQDKRKAAHNGAARRGERREGGASVREGLREQLKRPAQFVVRPLLVEPCKPLLPGIVTTALKVVHNRLAVFPVG